MSFRILAHLVYEHEQLVRLLDAAVAQPGAVDARAWEAFCAGHRRHMEVEERILLPALHRVAGDKTLAQERRLKLEHEELRSLLARPPRPEMLRELRAALLAHQEFEQAPGGLHEQSDRFLVEEAGELVALMRAYLPTVPPPPPGVPRDEAETLPRLPRVSGGGSAKG